MSIAALPAKGAYAQFMGRLAHLERANPDCVTRDPLDSWGRERTLREIRAEVRRALHRRINSRAGMDAQNWTTDREVDLRRDAHDVHDIVRHRLRVYQFRTRTVRARFGHLLAEREA